MGSLRNLPNLLTSITLPNLVGIVLLLPPSINHHNGHDKNREGVDLGAQEGEGLPPRVAESEPDCAQGAEEGEDGQPGGEEEQEAECYACVV